MRWIDHLLSLLRWKRFIVINTGIVAVGSVVVALILPEWFRSTTSIFPPEEESLSMGSLSSLVAISTLGVGRNTPQVFGSPSDVYASILRSRTVREGIIEQFDLMGAYKAENLDRAILAFASHVNIKVEADGILYVTVEDKDPQKAADMANAMVALLDRVNREKRATTGGRARAFVSGRLDQCRNDLAAAEDTLRVLSQRTGILEPEEQVRAIVRAGADLETQLLLKEVELGVLEARVGPNHPDREVLAREVRSLRAKLDALDQGKPGAGDAGSTDANRFEIPLADYPLLTMDYLRALREVKVQETIYEFLVQQLEQYKIQETRDTPTVYVLDPARPAIDKARPIRRWIVLASTGLAFALTVCIAAGLELLRRLRHVDPQSFERVLVLAGEVRLRTWLDRLLRP
ncbi:MAG: Wzz/FepE/Etk N-terminal domain-containing protein [Candidatus Eisenbacteria bacterium]|uniref:Polysaccharide chain length determinant N-terminal domain-containing protein n=1 Tax=Eiseniibacteriota bacterium TaxID=2212470 RepID=A0A956RPT8_UNCEI|nr:hypothetical protein [Candidatus Eisenbacteria bacterium]